MLTQTAIYALRAMAHLATSGDGKPVLSQTIAKEMKIPRNFLSKILHRLVREGLIRSIRGTNGGFVLARDARKVRLREVVEPFMSLDGFRLCFLGLHECRDDHSCKAHKKWSPVIRNFEKFLNETTIDKV